MLILAGVQVPVMVGELVDLVGNEGASELTFNGPIGLKVGVICGVVVITRVVVEEFCPESGVKV